MKKELNKQKQETIANTEFWYSGNHIVKLWEQYLKIPDPTIQFYSTNQEKPLDSIFNKLSQQ